MGTWSRNCTRAKRERESYRNAKGELVGRLRGMVFVGAPIGDDDWIKGVLSLIFRAATQRLPALARMRDGGRLQTAAQDRSTSFDQDTLFTNCTPLLQLLHTSIAHTS